LENKSLTVKVFQPNRRKGPLVMGSAGVLLIIASAMAFYLSYTATSGLEVILWIVLGAILTLPVLLLAYRGYALMTASYEVRREGLKLKWGLRSEEIPTEDIEWVRPARDLAFPLPLPRVWWAGSILGKRDVEGLGPVEFMAAESTGILLVAAPDIIFAISPEDENQFMRAVRHAGELGSLTPIQPQSVQPSFILGKLWEDQPARWLILGGLGLAIILLAIVTVIIPTRDSVNLGFTPSGFATLEPTSPERLLLLPVLNALAWMVDLVGGSYFFRKQEKKALAYLLWGCSPLLGLMLTAGVLLILNS
jgi:hypothetical protein